MSSTNSGNRGMEKFSKLFTVLIDNFVNFGFNHPVYNFCVVNIPEFNTRL